VERLLKAQGEKNISCGPGTARPLPEPWIGRQRGLFTVMNRVAQDIQIDLNSFITEGSCRFYNAPVALLVCLDRLFPASRMLCLGMALGYLLLAAEAKGLATCPIGLITAHEDEIKDHLNIPEEKQVLLGLALGYPDLSPINQVKSRRDEINTMIRWIT
jgi:nitroreductase